MASNFDLGNFELKEEISLSDLMLMPTQNLIDVKKDDTTCSTKRRFSTPMSNAELNKKIQDAIPRKTRSNNKWAVGVWVAWTQERNLFPETYADGGRAIPSDPNMLTNELDSACTMTLTVPNAIKKVVIFKNGKRYCLEI